MTPPRKLQGTQPLRQFRDRLATTVIVVGAVAVLAAILAIGVFLVWQSLPVLFIPLETTVAKLSVLAWGTLKAALATLLFAIPVALCAAVYTALYLPARWRLRIKPALEMMEAVPGVVVGFIAGVILAPWVGQHLASALALLVWPPASALLAGLLWQALAPQRLPFSQAWLWLIPWLLAMGWLALWAAPLIEHQLLGADLRHVLETRLGVDYATRNALIVGMAMGFAVVPGIYALADDALAEVPASLMEGAQALGADRWQTLWRVALPAAGPGIFSAVLIGAGRAVGETMIVLMASSNAALISANPLEGMRTIAAAVAIELPEAAPMSATYHLLIFAALVLFLFTFLVNTLAEVVRLRLRTRLQRLGGGV
ncbi:ABC transporter permease subunit [Vreelandella subglaciescola]|jgi:phosphate transport system permease protein|uniref:Phosphate transport system permease protein n=1 Tax=Vreelandella subglaciescola TaxID=29571 RepID=A0A1M7H3B4_9GAMM|nr:ABC transporter permease subunit [Halomonas subglaciescola]SHM23011.1 phosphate transport system permease protein [Halomonas subglaciescola]